MKSLHDAVFYWEAFGEVASSSHLLQLDLVILDDYADKIWWVTEFC